ncbi:MAG: N-6 DNA methylase [Clostridiales Family XIII bacterium]|jgi:tRNA1(Val) A37 N6-methylase TrmN6|nr:N-6 DNA methylase [Clostridiales Family XIII bacterium]
MGNVIDRQITIDLDKSISVATKRNWSRLGKTETKEQLSARANKRFSAKMIIPKESFDNVENVFKVEELINHIKIKEYVIDDALFSLGLNLLNRTKIKPRNIALLNSEYSLKEHYDLIKWKLPNESDILGLVYQCLQTEGEKNIKGSYYTPKKVVHSMVSDIKLKSSDKVLDPCCGSSVFLFNIPDIQPEQIFGVDIDPVAVMISKFNYFAKFPTTDIKPKIYEADFLALPSLLNMRSNHYQNDIDNNAFDYIITNPPWGGVSNGYDFPTKEIRSGEIFSYFIIKAFSQLKDDGIMRFLLPNSILNVKLHKDIREYLLNNTNLTEIKLHPGSFSGVMTQYISLETKKEQKKNAILVLSDENKKYEIKKTNLNADNFFVIRPVDNTDQEIIDLVCAKKKYDLGDSIWALGIVTGDNKGKLFDEQKNGFEPIYTGKEIAPFKLKKAKKYILYNRDNFQQVAKDEIYRADKKLVYKFISKKLMFSIDSSSSLFLNSANILIPTIPNMSINTVAAFLNSELYQYLYQKMFGEIKILKSSLTALPFVEITPKQDKLISDKVDELLKEKTGDNSSIQEYIYHIFGLNIYQVNHIKRVLYGNTH